MNDSLPPFLIHVLHLFTKCHENLCKILLMSFRFSKYIIFVTTGGFLFKPPTGQSYIDNKDKTRKSAKIYIKGTVSRDCSTLFQKTLPGHHIIRQIRIHENFRFCKDICEKHVYPRSHRLKGHANFELSNRKSSRKRKSSPNSLSLSNVFIQYVTPVESFEQKNIGRKYRDTLPLRWVQPRQLYCRCKDTFPPSQFLKIM